MNTNPWRIAQVSSNISASQVRNGSRTIKGRALTLSNVKDIHSRILHTNTRYTQLLAWTKKHDTNGGDVFHSTWKERIENNNGVMNAEAQGVKLRGLTDANQRIVDNSDIVLLSQNMINHSTANAIKKYAKQVNKPCESFEGFSANQIFRIVKSLDC